MSRPASSLSEDVVLRVFQSFDLRTAAIAAVVCPHWYQCYRSHVGTLQNLTTKDLLPGSEVGYLQHFNVVRNLAQLAPLLQRLACFELGLNDTNAAAGLITLQQLHSLRRLKLSPSNPARKLRLEFAALRLLPRSLTELQLHFVPAWGDDPHANMFPTVCVPNLRRLALRFGAVPERFWEAEPFQATDALCPLLTWLEVVGPNPWASNSIPTSEYLSVHFLTRFPAIQTLEVAEGQVERLFEAMSNMPHLIAARRHLDFYRPADDLDPLLLPVLQHLQVLQLNLRDAASGEAWPKEEGPLEYDLSIMPSLKWAMVIGPYLHLPAGIPRSLSKLLLVSNNTDNDRYQFQSDLSSLDVLALITVQDQCHFCPGGFSWPRMFLHEGDPTCNAAFPSDGKWYILLA